MTREQAKQNLVTIGVAEPSDEQITSYLNQLGGETQRERTRADKYKADAEKTAELQLQLDELNRQNMSDSERAKTEHDQALERIASLESTLRKKEIEVYASSKNLTSENMAKVLEAFGGDVDTAKAAIDAISELVTVTEQAARDDEKKQLLKETPTPHGLTGNTVTKPDDVANAEKIKFNTATAEQKDFYVLK